MQPNPEQMAILQAIHEGHRHIAVNALAGTGKSTTVRFSVDGGPLQGKAVQYVVFNRKNAEEAKQKLPGFVKVDTAHGLAWNGQHPEGGLIRAAYGNRMNGSLYVTVQTAPSLPQPWLSELFFVGGRLLGLGGSGVLHR